MRTSTLRTLTAVTLLAGCGTAPKPVPKGPTIDVAAPWRMLRLGDVQRARVGFRALLRAENTREGALAGLLRVALVEADYQRAGKLLTTLPTAKGAGVVARDPRLMLAAAISLLKLGRIEPGTRPLLERACKLKSDPSSELDALDVCSQLALHDAFPKQRQCRAGCNDSIKLPLTFIGTQPVVMASVNGGEPAPFVVDTGASTSVITTRYAKQIGLAAVAGTRWKVGSPGGLLTVERAAVVLSLGTLQVANLPVALIELPFEGIAGVISPHHAFPDRVASFDFRDFTLTLGGEVNDAADAWARWPLLLADGNPAVRTVVADRPPRPLVIDTGAFKTTLATALDKLGKPLTRAVESRVAGAGGKQARAWGTRESVAASAHGLRWQIEQPTLYERGAKNISADVESFGLLGMDFFMGRRLVLDLPRRRLLISREAQLAPWPVGAKARFAMIGEHFSRPTWVTEEVIESDAGKVKLEVTLRGQVPTKRRRRRKRGAIRVWTQKFRIVVPDSWTSRGAWLFARPVEQYFRVRKSGEILPAETEAVRERWRGFLPAFRTTGTNPKIEIAPLEVGAQTLACTRIAIDATLASSEAARLHIWECPATPWRTSRMELRVGERLLWGFGRVPLEQTTEP